MLLHASNPIVFEWSTSPIVYRSSEEFEKLKAVMHHYFIPKKGLYHYLNMASNNYRIYEKKGGSTLKHYLQVIRPILACKWILQKKTPPPVGFQILSDAYLDPQVKQVLEGFQNHSEVDTPNKVIINYIESSLTQLKRKIEMNENQPRKDWEELNALFASFLI
jgi:predicted nucleotidyltransferase